MLKDNHINYKRNTIESTQVIIYKDKIFVPEKQRNPVLTWYNHYLCYPGGDIIYKAMIATL